MTDDLAKRLLTVSQNYEYGKGNAANYKTIMDAITEITRLTSENRALLDKVAELAAADALTKERDELRLQTDRLAKDRSLGTRDVVLDYEKLASDVEAERSRVDIERKHAAYCQAQFDALDREFTELRMAMENFPKNLQRAEAARAEIARTKTECDKVIKRIGSAESETPHGDPHDADGGRVTDLVVERWRTALLKTVQERDALLREVELLKSRK